MGALTSAALTALLAGPAVFSAVYFPWALWCLRRAPEALSEAGEEPAVTFFRPLKNGAPRLREKLEMLMDAMRAGDQLLLGVEDGTSAAAVAEAVCAGAPGHEIVVVRCAPGRALNPKISKLVQMTPHARHGHWILSDSEAELDADFLRDFRREWTGCDVLTAGFRLRGARSWPERLDAAAVLLTLWPGLAVLRAAGGLGLTLGACTGVRRAEVEALGGWAALGEELAEDHWLGATLAKRGRRVRLCSRVATLEGDALSWREYWRHQRRVAITYRVANPAGFAGAFLTHGVTTSLLLAAWHPGAAWTWLLAGAVLAIRTATACAAGRQLGFPLAQPLRTVLAASVVETLCWAASWPARAVWWGGVRRRIGRDGRLREG